jgi:hypothetical protein
VETIAKLIMVAIAYSLGIPNGLLISFVVIVEMHILKNFFLDLFEIDNQEE